ncbi:MAG: hypothetical protein ACREV5_15205 [Steroidobacter sp.]
MHSSEKFDSFEGDSGCAWNPKARRVQYIAADFGAGPYIRTFAVTGS